MQLFKSHGKRIKLGLDPASADILWAIHNREWHFAACWARKGLFACMCQPFFWNWNRKSAHFSWFPYPIISWLSLSEIDFNPTSASCRDRFHQWCCCLVWPYGWIVASFWDWFLWAGLPDGWNDGTLHWFSSWLFSLPMNVHFSWHSNHRMVGSCSH